MSGIFGFVNLDGRPASPEEFQKMASAMSHWGPDGIGSVISANAAFGHALLIVTHESPYEKMPHHDTETDVLFTAAARLDNRDELCDLFGIPHPQRPTTPDGRLVWLAWRKWGREACRHIFGDWSFAAWDKKRKKAISRPRPYGQHRPLLLFQAAAGRFCLQFRGCPFPQ